MCFGTNVAKPNRTFGLCSSQMFPEPFQRTHRMDQPQWLDAPWKDSSKTVYQTIHELIGSLDDLETSGAQVAKLLGGTLLNEITTHMLAATNASTPEEERPRKMYLYSSVSPVGGVEVVD